jgi:hypothetical protein
LIYKAKDKIVRLFLKELIGENSIISTIGTVTLSVVASAIFEVIRPNILGGTLLILILIGLAYQLLFRKNVSYLQIAAEKDIPKASHVITGISFLNVPPDPKKETADKISNIRLIFNIVEKHQPKIKCLHLVLSKEENVTKAQVELYKWLNEKNLPPETFTKDISIIDGYDIGETYGKVNKYLKDLSEQGVNLREDVIIDITAGTAAMSSGLTMAALANGCNITYQATKRKQGDQLIGTTSWQIYKNRILQIWEEYPLNEKV